MVASAKIALQLLCKLFEIEPEARAAQEQRSDGRNVRLAIFGHGGYGVVK